MYEYKINNCIDWLIWLQTSFALTHCHNTGVTQKELLLLGVLTYNPLGLNLNDEGEKYFKSLVKFDKCFRLELTILIDILYFTDRDW